MGKRKASTLISKKAKVLRTDEESDVETLEFNALEEDLPCDEFQGSETDDGGESDDHYDGELVESEEDQEDSDAEASEGEETSDHEEAESGDERITVGAGAIKETAFLGDLQEVKQRIEDTLVLLENWKEARMDPSVASELSRDDLLAQISMDLSVFYGYNRELTNYFLKMFSPEEVKELYEANERPRPVVIRTNALKARRRELANALVARGVNVEPLAEWSKVGLIVTESTVPVGATPEHCAGHYILQSASSFIPVIALAPQAGETVLDMAAAPGGKSTYIAQLMKNKGILICNDSQPERSKSLAANLHRLGVTNAVTLCMDGRKLEGKTPRVDRVLLDAPCTGLGIIARDSSVKSKRKPRDFVQAASLQRELLLSAIDLCDANSPTGGYVVYSTCSVSIEENEGVVNSILNSGRDVKLVPFAPDIGSPGHTAIGQWRFPECMKLTRRFWPHRHDMDGFFVAKFRKLSNKVVRKTKNVSKYNKFVKTADADWSEVVAQ
ncbi:MAG: uncharacterized protein KVP18_000274 [Porospora cf. gigantea A]|uniref:uncharacterized protein n=1 Tax=Porospora cf. gigantea A TaxID=2853593 RepID=UPI00355A830D|nr:MAG: hypothetical protein KVP18_000274 [Porospora cf. gigantea A]